MLKKLADSYFHAKGVHAMGFNEALADSVRAVFSQKGVVAVEKRMMGGLCFMVDDKMCVGVDSDHLMVRLAPAKYQWALSQTGCVPMEFTAQRVRMGKPRGIRHPEPIRSLAGLGPGV